MGNGGLRFAFGSVFLAAVLLALGGGGWLAWFAYIPAQPGATADQVIEIRRGDSPMAIANQLATQAIISDAKPFFWIGRLTRMSKQIKAGEYALSAKLSPMEIWSVITSGVSIRYPITVREGENMYEIGDDLEAKHLATRARFITLCRDPKFIASLGFSETIPSLDGYLFPDTYQFDRIQSPEDIIRQMVRRFSSTWTDAERARAQAIGLTRHQIVTLASIIEKETGASHERPLISSVFHNRLRKKMRLQSDPTTIYGIWERYKGNIHRSDLMTANPFNTYTIPALPAGPIGNPGTEAIHAAMNPAQSEFLFFVSHNDGTHEFTRTLREHEAAVRKFQIDRKAREGKSWRDLRAKKSPSAGR